MRLGHGGTRWGKRSIVKRDLVDAEIEGLSADRPFIIAYNATLQLEPLLFYDYPDLGPIPIRQGIIALP